MKNGETAEDKMALVKDHIEELMSFVDVITDSAEIDFQNNKKIIDCLCVVKNTLEAAHKITAGDM